MSFCVARVPCYAIYTRDVVDDGSKMKAKDEDLVLSKVKYDSLFKPKENNETGRETRSLALGICGFHLSYFQKSWRDAETSTNAC